MWQGGPSLTGSPPPLATLTTTPYYIYDYLGAAYSGAGLQIADATGDGILDVIAGSILAYNPTIPYGYFAGVVYVWAGGSTLVGSPAPLATLRSPIPSGWIHLGMVSGSGIQVVVMTGDGVPGLCVGAREERTIDVWAGGRALIGTPLPLATLTATVEYLGLGSGQGVQIADVTGDGHVDVVAAASEADVAGVKDAGAIYVWECCGRVPLPTPPYR